MKLWFYLLISLTLLGTVACKKGYVDNNTNNAFLNGNTVTTLGTNCLNNSFTTTNVNGYNTCNNVALNTNYLRRYPVINQRYQGHNHSYSGGFTACGHGTVPVYHPKIGLACLPVAHLKNRGRLAYWNWNSISFNFSFYGYFSNNYSNVGYGGVFGLCGSSYGCGVGACQYFGGGSSWGVCGHGYSSSYQYDSYDGYGYDDYSNGGYRNY